MWDSINTEKREGERGVWEVVSGLSLPSSAAKFNVSAFAFCKDCACGIVRILIKK